MLRKNKLRKLISIGVISSTLATSGLAILGVYASTLKTTYNVNQTSTDDKNDSKGNALLDSKISSLTTPSSYYSINANDYYSSLNLSTLISSYSEKLKDETVSKISETIKTINADFSSSNFYKDILYFLKNIYKKANGNIAMSIVNDAFSATDSIVSFDYQVKMTNTTSTTISFSINGTSFYIPAKSTKTLSIKCDNQNYYFGVTKNYNNYYLNWNTNITVNFDGNDYSFDNFSFTKNDYSIAIQSYVQGLSSTNSYKDIADTDSYFNNLSSDDLKTNMSSYLSSNLELSLSMLSYLSPIIGSINSNTTLYNLLSNQKQNISEIILKLLGISNTDSNYDSYIKLFSDLLSSNSSLLTIIGNNGQALANFIALLVNDSMITGDVIYTYIKNINGNLTDDEINEQESSIKGLVSFFVSSLGSSSNIDLDFISNLITTLFNKNSTPLSLISYIFNDQAEKLINMLTTNETTKTTYKMYFKLIGLLVKNPSDLVLKVLLSNDGKQLLSDIVSNMMGSNSVQGDTSNSLILSLVKQIVSTSNSNLTPTTLSTLIKGLIYPLLNFLSDSKNYTLTNKFNNFSYDSTQHTVTYNYSIQFEFKNQFSFNINSILDILPDTLKLGSTSMPKSILTYILKQDGKALQMSIGVGDKIIFTFSGNNEQLYINPTLKNDGTYVAGFNIMYHLVMRLDMPTLFSSITSFYKTGTLHVINNSIVDVLKKFLSQLIIRDYDFYGMISITDNNTTISNYNSNVYYDGNYFSWKQPESSFYTELKNNITNTDSNSYSLKITNQNFIATSTKYETVTGSKPVISNDYSKKIQSAVMDYKSDIEPIIKITPEVNTNIPVNFIGVSLSSIQITLVKIQVWFPYSVINTTDSNNISFSNYFTVEINLS